MFGRELTQYHLAKAVRTHTLIVLRNLVSSVLQPCSGHRIAEITIDLGNLPLEIDIVTQGECIQQQLQLLIVELHSQQIGYRLGQPRFKGQRVHEIQYCLILACYDIELYPV
jgi:hypothetical protein